MKRFRYSLRIALVFTSALALFFGYGAWRREFILREHNALRSEGVTISPIEDSWWPKAPPAAVIIFKVSKSNHLIHHRTIYSFAEARRQYRDWEARLLGIGVGTVQLGIEGPKGYKTLNAPKELDNYAK